MEMLLNVKKDTNTNTNTNTKKRIKTIEVTDDNDAVIEMKLEDINDNDEIIQLWKDINKS